MNLSEMSAEQLLAEFENESRLAGAIRGNRLACDALRAELLRRLQPAKAICPECGSRRVTIEYFTDNSWGFCGERQCSLKANPSQFFASSPSVLSREGEGEIA